MVKRHKGKLKRAPPASHLATSPLAEVEPKGPQVLFWEMRLWAATPAPARNQILRSGNAILMRCSSHRGAVAPLGRKCQIIAMAARG